MNAQIKTSVLRKLTYGMWILSATADGDFEASTVTWMSQASFSPPLVMLAIKADTHLHRIVEKSRAFALQLLTASQKDLAASFIKPTVVEAGKIGGLAHRPGPATGSPLLEGFTNWLEARVIDIVKRGDHSIFVAEVVDAGQTDADAKPLVLADTGWHYGG